MVCTLCFAEVVKMETTSASFLSSPEIGEFHRGIAEFTQVIDKLAKQVESEKMKVEHDPTPHPHTHRHTDTHADALIATATQGG